MAKASCYVCGKSIKSGNNVSHSNRKTKRTWRPNLHTVRIREGKKLLNVKVCARCIKSNVLAKA